MSDEPAAGLSLRAAKPADLPQLEIWAAAARPDERPPYIAVTLSEFERRPGRGDLLIVRDGETEIGYVVISRLWSNRRRGDIAVIDDVVIAGDVDQDLVLFEAKRFAEGLEVVDVEVGSDRD